MEGQRRAGMARAGSEGWNVAGVLDGKTDTMCNWKQVFITESTNEEAVC